MQLKQNAVFEQAAHRTDPESYQSTPTSCQQPDIDKETSRWKTDLFGLAGLEED